ncbi:hypothetical protein BX265_6215 [Streptomyces sp. TLI_235]|nr:hypothetical protein [Streptomyces sp. TLI_235]PBC71604.1 hypothetical protein BX265_6215 [Streptomyces sp. TLI_235]
MRNTYILTADDIDRPARFDSLPAAVAALRALLGTLRLDPSQAEAYAYFLRDPARVQDYLDTTEEFELEFVVGGRTRTAVIRPE